MDTASLESSALEFVQIGNYKSEIAHIVTGIPRESIHTLYFIHQQLYSFFQTIT